MSEIKTEIKQNADGSYTITDAHSTADVVRWLLTQDSKETVLYLLGDTPERTWEGQIDNDAFFKSVEFQPEQEPVALKLMPREATREMLEAMDECSTEGYDERLYAGHAASVYMAAWDAQQPQPEQYITDAMKVRQAVAQALLDDVYAEELEQPEAKQSGTISITMPAPVAYLCENAVGHKYFRWKKPSSTYKPVALYTTPPQRTWVGLTDEEIWQLVNDCVLGGDLHPDKFALIIEAKLKEKNLDR